MPNEIPIQIDKQHFKVTEPVTGAQLYGEGLGNVPAGYDLWLESRGKEDDTFVPNTTDSFDVRSGDKFYTAQSSLNPGQP